MVNAGGMFAAEIGRLAGVRVPVIPFAHEYLVTQPFRERGRPGDRAPADAARPRPARLLPRGGRRADHGRLRARQRAVGARRAPGRPRSRRTSTAGCWRRTGRASRRSRANSVQRVPAMDDVKVTRLINGPEAFTPDNEFCLGETEVRGLLRRRRVLRPRPGRRRRHRQGDGRVDRRRRARRSTSGRWTSAASGAQYRSPRYTLARAQEVYETYYDIRYPGHERQAGPPAADARSAYAWHREHGAAFGEKSGWERVNWYESNAAGGRCGAAPARLGGACTGPRRSAPSTAAPASAAALFDESSFAKLEVAGPGAARAARAAVRQPTSPREVGAITYTQMLNRRGGIECDFTVTRLAEEHVPDRHRARRSATTTRPGSAATCPHDGSVRCRDVTSRWACFALWGPRAARDPAPADARPRWTSATCAMREHRRRRRPGARAAGDLRRRARLGALLPRPSTAPALWRDAVGGRRGRTA